MSDPRTAPTARLAGEAPVPAPGFPRLELAEWAERHGLVAGITTRGAGFSREAFLHAMQARFPTVVLGHQIHGTRVAWHPHAARGWLVEDDADGHAASFPGVLLTVTVADCIPVYLADVKRGVVALLHAGWRGIAGQILGVGLQALRDHAGSSPADLIMHCGIGICGRCYVVGREVVEALALPAMTGAAHVDLRSILADQATRLGVRDVTASPHCTACDRSRFFSHRGSGGRDGRMVAYLGRPLT